MSVVAKVIRSFHEGAKAVSIGQFSGAHAPRAQ
jgi:hypothetical protein